MRLFLFGLFLLMLSASNLYAENTQVWDKKFEHHWTVNCHVDGQGDFSHCTMGVRFVDELQFIVQLNGKGSMALKLYNDKWVDSNLREGMKPIAVFTFEPSNEAYSFQLIAGREPGDKALTLAGVGRQLDDFLARLATEKAFGLVIGKQDLGGYLLKGSAEPIVELMDQAVKRAKSQEARRIDPSKLEALFATP